jgi:hypothetical protein
MIGSNGMMNGFWWRAALLLFVALVLMVLAGVLSVNELSK